MVEEGTTNLLTAFQSSPSPKAGSYVGWRAKRPAYGEVSILSQPEGRELHVALLLAALTLWCFNPLPARRPGATVLFRAGEGMAQVSILSQPEGRELQHR